MKQTIDISKENIISLCPIKPKHADFLLQLFKECRPDLAMIGNFNEKQKEDFILQQFTIEQEQLIKTYPDAEFNIVILNKEPIGRLCIHYGKTADRILEIGIFAKYRSLGIGRKLITTIIENTKKKNKNVRLQVAWFNQRAYKFYKEIGFKVIENQGVSFEMEYINQQLNQV